ncbi:MAG: Rab family GTPase [Candidatus Thermoplasmatota archaeon]
MIEKGMIKKMCMLGDAGVGKTSLVKRYVYNIFSDEYIETIGTNISKKVIELKKNVVATLLIWDITGHLAHTQLHSSYFEGSDGAFIVGDITRKETIDNMDLWLKRFYDVVGENPVVFIINKCDLIPPNEKISKKFEGKLHIFTSAKTGENVEDAFRTLCEKMVI